jgi:hypothetical protein
LFKILSIEGSKKERFDMKSFICCLAVIIAAGPVLAWEGVPSGGHTLSKDCFMALQQLTAEKTVVQDVEKSDLGTIDAGLASSDRPSTKTLKDYCSKTFEMMDCFTLDAKGQLVASLHQTRETVQSKETYFVQCYNNGQGALFLDRPEAVKGTTGDVMKIALPVKDGDKTIGVLVATVILG